MNCSARIVFLGLASVNWFQLKQNAVLIRWAASRWSSCGRCEAVGACCERCQALQIWSHAGRWVVWMEVAVRAILYCHSYVAVLATSPDDTAQPVDPQVVLYYWAILYFISYHYNSWSTTGYCSVI